MISNTIIFILIIIFIISSVSLIFQFEQVLAGYKPNIKVRNISWVVFIITGLLILIIGGNV